MTPIQAKAVVKAMFDEYCSLIESKGITVEQAAERIGVSRPRFYQLKKGDTMLNLPNFLTLMDAVSSLKAAKKKLKEEATQEAA